MSENISAAISVNGEIVMKQPLIKSMRVVKKETLKLISDWVSRTNDHQMVRLFVSGIFPTNPKIYFFILFHILIQNMLIKISLFIRCWKILYRHCWMPFCWIIKRRMFIVLESPKCLVLWPP